MLPPSPLTFPWWGVAVWAGLTAGLWQALAAPWLAPVWPRTGGRAAGARGAGAAADAAPGPAPAGTAAPPGVVAPGGGGQVIRVPQARWRARRG